ncbi:MAG: amidase [Rhodanobacter sp.]
MPNLSAIEIVAAVHRGALTPIDTVRAALAQAEAHTEVNAMQELFSAEALGAAGEMMRRTDLATLPLAGLPILIKDNVSVAGHPMRDGSQATSSEPVATDHEVVRRLRAAGAIIIGVTRVPELCIWASTDSAFGITRNPWNLQHTPGGSSGGSAAAVAAGIVPVAHGNDGMGSIRIPAANTGLFGFKPGRGVVPAEIGKDSWGGMAENGPLATSVADAALVLSVMAERPALAELVEPAAPLRIAIAGNSPSFLVRLHPSWRHALDATADALREDGHHVEYTRFPYPLNPMPLFVRWFAGAAADAADLDVTRLEPRTRRHVQLGRLAQHRGWVKPQDAEHLAATARQFFTRYDILLTPMLAHTAPAAEEWHRRSWLRNIWSNLRYAPYAALWNVLGWPAASIPAGLDPATGMPTAVQIVARPGAEGTLLGLAAQLERLRPWRRTAQGSP